MWEVLHSSPVSYTLTNALKNLYAGSRSRVKIGNSLTNSFPVTKGLRQGCCISPTLFKIYVAAALKGWKRKVNGMGIELNNTCLYTLQFADDQVVIANDREDIEYMMRKLVEEYSRWGLDVNIDKTKYLCVGSEENDIHLTMENNQKIKACQDYKYLGVTFDKTGTDDKEITSRIIQAKRAIRCLNNILWSTQISNKRKFNIYETMIKSSLLYDAETWRLTEKNKNKIEVVEMDAIRRSLRISRREHIRNEDIKNRMGIEGTIMKDIERRQLIWYGHVNRMNDERLPKQCLEWQPPEHRKRGRPKVNWTTGIRKAMSARDLRDDLWQNRKEWNLGIGQRRKTF